MTSRGMTRDGSREAHLARGVHWRFHPYPLGLPYIFYPGGER